MSRARRIIFKAVKTAAWLFVPILVTMSIWLPVSRHYYMPTVPVSNFILELARREPPEAALRELRGDRLIYHGWKDSKQVVAAAEKLLRGELHLSGHTPITFRLPFHPHDLTPNLPSAQLPVAGLIAADLLLQAYESTGQERFFRAAKESISEFARYERNARVPRGLLWNDHAVANRVFVISDFWRVYRRHDDYRPEAARTILELVERSGEFLSKREHFTFASNHGVMQSLALLRLRLSFPAMPKAGSYQRLAMERLDEQMAFYVNEEGVVLEHSAAYQAFGIELLEMVFRYTRLLRLPIPTEWQGKYTRALQFQGQLRRPDGSLPLFGDTSWHWPEVQGGEGSSSRSAVSKAVPKNVGPVSSVSWYPVAGYAVWWDGWKHWPESRDLHQTVVSFSYFPGHAHKHADDLSVLLWAAGRTWWSNLGFWPYDLEERSQAESWNGSNAPHLIEEPKDSQRTPKMLFYGSSERTVAVDVAREGPGGYFARRQVIKLRPNVWLTLDSISGSLKRRSMTRWTTGHGISLHERGKEGQYVLKAHDGSARLFTFFLGSPGLSVRRLPQVLGPFVRRSFPDTKPAVSAIDVEQRADASWAMAVWLFDANGKLPLSHGAQPKMVLWRGPEDWTAILPTEPTLTHISRRGDRLFVRDGEGRLVDTVPLRSADVTPQREVIRRAFLTTTRKYPTFRDRPRHRQWATYLLVVVVGVQELSLLIVPRISKRAYGWLRPFTLALWIIGGIWLATFFG